LATARILSIDDSPTVLKLIEMIGQAAGYEVHVANDGRRGVEMAAELHPDVILVDFIMPEMNGLQVCKALHDNPETRDIPIILVSSKGEAVGDKFVATLGVRHYCTKPFKAEELLAKLSEILGEQGDAASETVAEQPAAAEPEAETSGQPVILSIDDSPTILRLVEMILTNAGFTVRTAAGGAKGIELARQLHPDVVLVDFIMPEVNGFQVSKTLREDPETRDIPIILVSSKGEAVGEQFVQTLGIHHYLTKPFQPDQLVAEVRTALEAGAPATIADSSPTTAPPASTHEAVAPAAADAATTGAMDDADAVDALRSHLDGQLAAMEERLIAILDRRLQEVVEEIRNRVQVGSR